MIERIQSLTNPDFFFLNYNPCTLEVKNFILIPKYFFVPEIIEKRSPLSPTARRAGWSVVIFCSIKFLITDESLLSKKELKFHHIKYIISCNELHF